MVEKPLLLSSDEITHALEKGTERAQQLCDRASDISQLKDTFDLVAKCAQQILDNFDKDKYQNRKNHKLPAQQLKNMILDAFKSVQTLAEIESALALSSHNGLPAGKAIGKTASLVSAANVFLTRGVSDEPDQNIIDIIREYQQHPHIHYIAA